MNAESQDHWCGYSPRDGTVDVPVQLSASTPAALACSDPADPDGSYTTGPEPTFSRGPDADWGPEARTGPVRSVRRAESRVVRSTQVSPKDIRPSGPAVATVELRLFNTQNPACNARLMNARRCT
ncbi:hypothetical protein GCM10022206_08750 [Streptomyces chiangmaiensis]